MTASEFFKISKNCSFIIGLFKINSKVEPSIMIPNSSFSFNLMLSVSILFFKVRLFGFLLYNDSGIYLFLDVSGL